MKPSKFRSWPVLSLFLLSLPVLAADHNVIVACCGPRFSPSVLTVNAGDTVTWTFAGGDMAHNVVADGLFRCAQGCDGEGGSGNPSSDPWTVTRTFSTPDTTVNYYCEVHKDVGMTGRINVVPGAAVFDLNRHGLTGSWFQPVTAGQGAEIEVYKDLIGPGTGFLQGAWFTYDYKAPDGAASQRWYTFSGNVLSGQSGATLTMYQNVGGNFNAPPVTTATPVGRVDFSAIDCTHASMKYTFTDGSMRSGTVPMIRLLPNVTCSTTGPDTPSADFAYSGNWFDKTTSGQGIVMEVNPNLPVTQTDRVAAVQTSGFVFFAWYTYAPNGQSLGEAGQRWYTGQAPYTPGARALPMTLYETTGGLFDSATPVPNTVPVGTATATFTSCNALNLGFAFTGGSSAGSSGTINMSRVGPTPVGCAR